MSWLWSPWADGPSVHLTLVSAAPCTPFSSRLCGPWPADLSLFSSVRLMRSQKGLPGRRLRGAEGSPHLSSFSQGLQCSPTVAPCLRSIASYILCHFLVVYSRREFAYQLISHDHRQNSGSLTINFLMVAFCYVLLINSRLYGGARIAKIN